ENCERSIQPGECRAGTTQGPAHGKLFRAVRAGRIGRNHRLRRGSSPSSLLSGGTRRQSPVQHPAGGSFCRIPCDIPSPAAAMDRTVDASAVSATCIHYTALVAFIPDSGGNQTYATGGDRAIWAACARLFGGPAPPDF